MGSAESAAARVVRSRGSRAACELIRRLSAAEAEAEAEAEAAASAATVAIGTKPPKRTAGMADRTVANSANSACVGQPKRLKRVKVETAVSESVSESGTESKWLEEMGEASAGEADFSGAMAYLKALSPAAVDAEFRMLAVDLGDDASEEQELALVVRFFLAQVRSHVDFEFAQALLNLFLKVCQSCCVCVCVCVYVCVCMFLMGCFLG